MAWPESLHRGFGVWVKVMASWSLAESLVQIMEDGLDEMPSF
jgi:hypothetical protein